MRFITKEERKLQKEEELRYKNFWEDEWWNNPCLQGPENDYGEYDYMINYIPRNTEEFYINRYRKRCSDCGHKSFGYRQWTAYFNTYDGYDSISGEMCIRCVAQEQIRKILRKREN